MSSNPYAPPMAAVADIVPPEEMAGEPPFFAVSLTKLAVMSLCTLSLYEVYWFYRNWQRIADRERLNVWPLMRAIFGVFYCYPCFAHIRDYQGDSQVDSRLPALALAAGFIVSTLTWRLPDPWGWISVASFLFLLPVQHRANRLNAFARPAHDRNSRFSGWNWVAVVVGVLFVLLAVAGTLIEPEA